MDRPTNLMVINSVLRFDRAARLGSAGRGRSRASGRPLPALLANASSSGRAAARRPALGGGSATSTSGVTCITAASPAPATSGRSGSWSAISPRSRSTAASRCGTCTWSTAPARGSAVIVRMHHCIADGIALARVMLSLTDSEPDAPGEPERPAEPRASRSLPAAVVGAPLAAAGDAVLDVIAGVGGTISSTRHLLGSLTGEARRTLAHPRHAVELAEEASADGQRARQAGLHARRRPQRAEGRPRRRAARRLEQAAVPDERSRRSPTRRARP